MDSGRKAKKSFSWDEAPSQDDQEFEGYEQTRKSLIAKLANWEDQKAWDLFYKTYWKLIYSVALKAGLRSEEAFDVVQETVLCIAKQSQKGLYEADKGSFKSWLLNMTRWRIQDQFRKRKKDTASPIQKEERLSSPPSSPLEKIEDPHGNTLERLWDIEWKKNISHAALTRLKSQVSPKQYQIFDYYVLRGVEASEVQSILGVSMTQIYLAKHRLGKILKREVAILKKQDSQ